MPSMAVPKNVPFLGTTAQYQLKGRGSCWNMKSMTSMGGCRGKYCGVVPELGS